MELFDYLIIGTGILLIVMGWLCYRFPNMINPYGSMSPERKALVDINGLKRATAIILTIMGLLIIVADVFRIFNVIDLEVASWLFPGSVLIMIIPIIIVMKKYNGFGRDKTGEGVYGPRLERPAKWTLVILGLSMVFVAVILAMSSRPQRITVGEESVKISGMYGREIPFADIVSVKVLEQLPPIKMRTNGSSTGKYSKGHFLLENDENCMLFVRHKMPPYIEIRTTDNLYYFNGASEEETLSLFKAIDARLRNGVSTGSTAFAFLIKLRVPELVEGPASKKERG
ncbi:MAG: DUF3784 domain-containing protein [Bacteroidales bacterium]|nr:DUF3784 domain-containing protein [Bacteroidales bacterium]